MVTKSYKVYGVDGHRQRESFNPSYKYDFSYGDELRIIEVQNSDITGTNEYSRVIITRNTDEECDKEIRGQVSDGIFENCRVGGVVEEKEEEKMFKIRGRETGYVITKHDTYEEALNELYAYEAEDRANGNYEEDYYEIVGPEGETILKACDKKMIRSKMLRKFVELVEIAKEIDFDLSYLSAVYIDGNVDIHNDRWDDNEQYKRISIYVDAKEVR